jgi:hypothetical protein
LQITESEDPKRWLLRGDGATTVLVSHFDATVDVLAPTANASIKEGKNNALS